MRYVFKAIDMLKKVKANNEDIKSECDYTIRRLRQVVRDQTDVDSYFLTAEEIEIQEESYWRFRNKDKDRKPIFRKAKNGVIININGNYYIDSIKEALKEGSPQYLKSKDIYYRVNNNYYNKNEYILYNGVLYSKDEYELVNGNLIDKTLVGELYEYDNKRRESVYEKYYLRKKPIPVDRLCRDLITEDTDAVVSIYLDAQSNSWPLSNCFKYRDDILCRGINSVSFGNKWISSYKICFPIEEIENIKYEVPQEIRDGFERLKNKLKDKVGLRSIDRYIVRFDIVTKKSPTKKYKILKTVFEKMRYIKTVNINTALKMIKDIMEVK